MSEGKVCKKCGVWKELEGFQKMRGVNRASTCKVCVTETRLEGTRSKTKKISEDGVHQCRTCGKVLPVSSFKKRARLTSGSVCEDCHKERNRKQSEKYRGTLEKPIKTHFTCKTCQQLLPKEAFISKNKNVLRVKSDSNCVSCHSAKMLAKSQSEKRKTYRKEYYEEHSTTIREKSKAWYEENKDHASARDRKWREENKEKKQEMDRQYNINNKEEIRRRVKEFSKSPARWETYGTRIPLMDKPKDANGVVEVVCKNCRSRFIPTVQQCQNRIIASNVLDKGDANFYCSEKCKHSCDIYRAQKLPASRRHRRSRARSCQQDVKRSLIASQCADKGMVQCEVCGDVGSVDLHHTLPVKGYEDKISEAASMMLVCAGCHAEIHRRCK